MGSKSLNFNVRLRTKLSVRYKCNSEYFQDTQNVKESESFVDRSFDPSICHKDFSANATLK